MTDAKQSTKVTLFQAVSAMALVVAAWGIMSIAQSVDEISDELRGGYMSVHAKVSNTQKLPGINGEKIPLHVEMKP